MKLVKKTERLYVLKIGYVKLFLLKAKDHLVLIDTGNKGNGKKILKAIDKAGLESSCLKYILVSHLHNDHSGSLSELKKLTGATVYAHEEEADAIEEGIVLRPFTPSPRFPGNVMFAFVPSNTVVKQNEGCPVDCKLKGNEFLTIGGGIQIISTPGHTKGHISFLLKDEKILIAGDVGSGGKIPGYPFLFEDIERGLESLKLLGDLDFNIAYFSHGRTITERASLKFREQF